MKVGYYAIFNYEEYHQIEYGISILFPDIPEIASCARTRDEALIMAKEALELATCVMKVHEMPKVTPLEEIKLGDKEEAVFISYNTEEFDLSTIIFYGENDWKEKWYPAKYTNLCSMYDVRAIEDCIEGLFIELVPDSIVEAENKKHKTIYLHWPVSYVSYMDSKSGARNLANLDENNNRWTFFKIKESAYLGFIKKDSSRIEGDNLEHFCIIGTNSVVDVLSPYEPKILDKNKNTIAGGEGWDE